ncbi:MAG: PASTA domain-containing protein [Bacteroidales bacterium]|jgi:beta-lactam-binding protein with PASTA domain|nr:PASTA domain-containing protein [Bacteroidales bacterium]
MALSSKLKTILINLGILTLVCIVAILVFRGWLSSYTNHGVSIEVPDFQNFTIAEAQVLAEQKNITIVVADTVFDETKKGNIIVSTKPSAGEFVKEQRTIYATINSGSPLMVRLPKLVNMSLRQAQINIESAGLTIGTIDYMPGRANDYVLEAHYKNKPIAAGTRIPKGSKINLVVEKGGAIQDFIVPNLIGKTYSEATTMISALGAGIDAVFDNRYPYYTTEDTLNAIVWKQSPLADSLSSVSTITIHLIKE